MARWRSLGGNCSRVKRLCRVLVRSRSRPCVCCTKLKQFLEVRLFLITVKVQVYNLSWAAIAFSCYSWIPYVQSSICLMFRDLGDSLMRSVEMAQMLGSGRAEFLAHRDEGVGLSSSVSRGF